MSERDREPDLHWSMAADYTREDLERKFRAGTRVVTIRESRSRVGSR
jgi:hypothetical protein